MKPFLIVLAVLLFLLLAPITARVSFREGFKVYAGILYPLFKVYPLNAKKKKEKRKKETVKKTAESQEGKKSKKKKIDFFTILDLIRRTPRYLKRLISIRRLKMDILLGNADPADLAVTFGAVNAALESALAFLSPVFPVDRWKIRTAVDFDRESSEFNGKLFAHTNLIRILSVLCSVIFRVIMKKENV